MTTPLTMLDINYYKELFNFLDEGFCIIEVLFDSNGKPFDYRFLEYNKAFETQTGLTDVIGKTVLELVPLHEKHWFEIYGRVATTGEAVHFQNKAEQLGRFYEVSAHRFGKPKDKQVAVLFWDIKKQKEAENNLKNALNEKELLLKELYHRTKNNLQVISSLLNLRSAKIQDESYRNAFLEMRNRIQAMALVHERLYQTQTLTRLDFGMYVKDLLDLLIKSHSDDSDRIELNCSLGNYEVSIDTAITGGLIVTELVLNVLKYAFPFNRKGKLNVSLVPSAKGGVTLVIEDDGVGIPSQVKEESLGINLVKGLVEDQLNGKITLESSSEGTRWEIFFK